MAIKIGDDNKIKKSNIIDNSNCVNVKSNEMKKEAFANRHPILIGIGCSIVASVIMMSAFWDKVSEFIENLF